MSSPGQTYEKHQLIKAAPKPLALKCSWRYGNYNRSHAKVLRESKVVLSLFTSNANFSRLCKKVEIYIHFGFNWAYQYHQ